MEQQPKTSKFSMQYGLFLGLASIAFSVLQYTQGLHYEQDPITMVVGFGLLLVFIILGIVAYKKANNGLISLGQAIKVGVGISLIGAVLGTLYFFIFMNVIEPDYLDKVLAIGREAAIERQPDIDRDALDQGLEFQRKFFPVFLGVGILINVIVGLVFSLITGLVVKKTEE